MKSCRECARSCAIKNSTNVYCTLHNVEIAFDNELCDDFLAIPSQDPPPIPSPKDIKSQMKQFCAAHNNCAACPHWHLHDTSLCTIQFTIDTIKKTLTP